MGFLLDSLDEAKFKAQRDIVKNERRQSVDNQPYGRGDRDAHGGDVSEVASVLVAVDRLHGRSPARVGRGREAFLPPLLRAEQRDARDRRRLRAGAGEGAGSRSTSRRSSARQGDRRARRSRRSTLPAKSGSSSRIACRCRGCIMQWPTVGVRSDDQYALDLLATSSTRSRIARLTKALVYDKQSAAHGRRVAERQRERRRVRRHR